MTIIELAVKLNDDPLVVRLEKFLVVTDDPVLAYDTLRNIIMPKCEIFLHDLAQIKIDGIDVKII